MVGRKTHVHCELMCSKLPPIKKATNTENYIPGVAFSRCFTVALFYLRPKTARQFCNTPPKKKSNMVAHIEYAGVFAGRDWY